MTAEQCARISAALVGRGGHTHVTTDETKAKLSAAHEGMRATPETRAKMSAARMGHIVTPETRAKMSATKKGKPKTAEHRAHLSEAKMGTQLGSSNPHWKGGPVAYECRKSAKRRVLGCVPLNEPFAGCEGHHVDNEQVIYVPKVLHRSIRHRQDTGQGMAQMNATAYNFLFKQEVQIAIATAAAAQH
jgi:hypothetical protein